MPSVIGSRYIPEFWSRAYGKSEFSLVFCLTAPVFENSVRPGPSPRHQSGMAQTTTDTQTWPDLAIGLYDKLTGRGAEITYEFQSMEISVPSSASPTAQHATWRFSGTVKIRTRDEAAAPRA